MSKEMFGKIGVFLVLFVMILVIVDSQGSNVWVGNANNAKATAQDSLVILWTKWTISTPFGLAAVVLLQGFVLFAALLGANLQFTPPEDH